MDRLNQRWVRAVTTGVMGAAIVTGIFILAGGQISERVFLVPLIFSGTIAIAATLVLPWVERAETRLRPGAQRLVVAITFIGVAALGALAAGGLVLATGIVPTERSWYVMTSGLGIALLVAMLLFTHEMARERRTRAERALEAEAARRQTAERLATEARLASLESRLQPHFLRNALNTIAHHVVADPPRAEDLLEQLAGLLGASLERTTRRTVPLREEIRLVWDYLEYRAGAAGGAAALAAGVLAGGARVRGPPLLAAEPGAQQRHARSGAPAGRGGGCRRGRASSLSPDTSSTRGEPLMSGRWTT